MKKLALVFAVGADTVKVKAATDVVQRSTDISSRHRHRHYGHRHHGYRHYGYRHYRPYYGNSYGYYAPRPYYGGYGYGGPAITFGFGRGW
jgi:hypothetical protein